jgi:hypothetical protein
MRLPRGVVALLAATAVAIPAVAFAVPSPPAPPTPANAYGVICQREPTNNEPGSEAFRNCVRALAQGTRGTTSPSDAARKVCRNATPPLPGDEFGECVSSTKTLVQGLKAIRAQ